MLVGRIGQVGAGEIPLAALDHGNQAAALAGILSLRVLQDCCFQCFADDHLLRPAPGKLPNGKAVSGALNVYLALEVNV